MTQTDQFGRTTNDPGTGHKTDTDQAKAAASGLAESARDTGKQAYEAATEAASKRTDEARGRAADEVSEMAQALRRSAEEMRAGSAQERTLGQIAESLADASDAIRDKDLSEIVGGLNDFARRNPMTFLGGAALIGFAASRFAKATAAPAASSSTAPDAPGFGAGPSYPPYDRGAQSTTATRTAAPAVHTKQEAGQ